MVKEIQTCCGKVAHLVLKVTLQTGPNSQARSQGPKQIKFFTAIVTQDTRQHIFRKRVF